MAPFIAGILLAGMLSLWLIPALAWDERAALFGILSASVGLLNLAYWGWRAARGHQRRRN